MKKRLTSTLCLVVFFIIFLMGCTKTTEKSDEPYKPSYFVPQDPPPAQYSLEAEIQVKEKTAHLEGKGQIMFCNSTEKPVSVVALRWGGSLLKISMDGKNLQIMDANPIEEGVRFFSLPQICRPGEELVLEIRFQLEANASDNGDIALQRFYPKLWWEGLPTRDSFRVKLDVPTGFKAATSGRLDPNIDTYVNPGVTTNFGLYLYQDIHIEEKEIEGVKVRVFFKDQGKECALLCLQTAEDVIRFYKEINGFFPFPCLTMIPGGAGPWGGYPYASALVVIHGMQAFDKASELHWKWITAHEIGHQYWGETIMSDEYNQYSDSWLMIGMGIFTDRMYVESRKLGDEKHDNFFQRYIKGVKSRFDTTADAPESLLRQQKYDRNNILIHGKGYAIVSALRSTLGDELFKRVYFRCLEEYRGERMNYHDLRKIAEEESGRNLHWFFEQWVRSSQYLCYQITSMKTRKEGKEFVTEVTVEPQGDSMTMPVDVKAVFKDGSSQTNQTSRFFRKNIILFRSESELDKVVLDPLNRLAMLDKPLSVQPDELSDRVRGLPYSGAWNQGLKLYRIALESGLQDHSSWFKLGMVIFEGGCLEESFSCFQKVRELDAPEMYDFVAVTWQANVRDTQGRRDEAVKYYRRALELSEGKRAMRHDQFGIQTSREWIEQRLKSPFNWKSIIKN